MGNDTTSLARIGDQEFAILKINPREITSIVRENCGDGISALDLDRVKIPAGGTQAWTIPGLDGDEIVKEFYGVVMFHKAGRVFWEKGIEESGGNSPPDCSSDDGITGVGTPGGDCAQCPFAKFGSDARGGKGQACKQIKQVFVIRPGNIIPVMISLPPTSLRPAKQYFLRLANVGKHYTAVLTRFSLVEDKNADGIKYSKIVMAKVADLTPDQAGLFKRMSDLMRPWLSKVKVASEDYEAAPTGQPDSEPAAGDEAGAEAAAEESAGSSIS